MNNYYSTEKDEALNQSIALTDIVKDLLETTKAQLSKVYVILAISIAINLLITVSFLWYNSQYDYAETTTTQTTVTQETDGNSDINNVQGDQYNDRATHNRKE